MPSMGWLLGADSEAKAMLFEARKAVMKLERARRMRRVMGEMAFVGRRVGFIGLDCRGGGGGASMGGLGVF